MNLRNKIPVLTALNRLLKYQQDKNKQLLPIGGSGVNLTATELYANKEVSVGAGTIPLLSGASVREVGITNFDGNQLEKGRIFTFDEVTILLGIDKKGAATGTVKYFSLSNGSTDIKKAFDHIGNANLIIKQSNEIVTSLPVRAIVNAQIANSDSIYRDLGSFEVLEDNKAVDISIEFPSGAEVPGSVLGTGNGLFISVVAKGFETYVKR